MADYIKLTSGDFYTTDDLIPDTVLDESDPIMNIKRLAGIDATSSLSEYTGYAGAAVESNNTHVSMSSLISVVIR